MSREGSRPTTTPPGPVNLPLLSMLGSSPTNMAVRCQSHCISAAGSDMDAYAHWTARLEQWMAHPGFDAAEFSRLCRHYQLD